MRVAMFWIIKLPGNWRAQPPDFWSDDATQSRTPNAPRHAERQHDPEPVAEWIA
jgi:hypothetical protein